MRPVKQNVTDEAPLVVPLDLYLIPPVAVQMKVISGAPSVTVEYTLDDVFVRGFDQSTALWNSCGAPFDAAKVAAVAGVILSEDNIRITPRALRFTNSVAASSMEVVVTQTGLRE